MHGFHQRMCNASPYRFWGERYNIFFPFLLQEKGEKGAPGDVVFGPVSYLIIKSCIYITGRFHKICDRLVHLDHEDLTAGLDQGDLLAFLVYQDRKDQG